MIQARSRRTWALLTAGLLTLVVGLSAGGVASAQSKSLTVGSKDFAGGLLVALLAIALEFVLALVQRALTSPGIRAEGKVKVRDLATDPVAPTGAML